MQKLIMIIVQYSLIKLTWTSHPSPIESFVASASKRSLCILTHCVRVAVVSFRVSFFNINKILGYKTRKNKSISFYFYCSFGSILSSIMPVPVPPVLIGGGLLRWVHDCIIFPCHHYSEAAILNPYILIFCNLTLNAGDNKKGGEKIDKTTVRGDHNIISIPLTLTQKMCLRRRLAKAQWHNKPSI